MLVDDCVAFACTFLPDNKLHDYLRKLTEKLMEDGNLDGILLTGKTNMIVLRFKITKRVIIQVITTME